MLSFRIIGIRMMSVVELHDMESTSIHIKMYVTLLKVWRNRFPYLYFGVKLLNFAPGGIPHSFAVLLWRSKQNITVSLLTIHTEDYTADRSAIQLDAISFSVIN